MKNPPALLAALLAIACPSAGAAPPEPASAWVDRHAGELLTFYKGLHEHPELSFREEKTAARVAEALRETGAKVSTGVGKLGVVGVMENGPGPTLLLRTDIDALPVTEATGLPYASKATVTDAEGKSLGVMHACGHDMHMTCFVGVARWLAENRPLWSGRVLLVAQPAEELVSGAKAMLDDGLYERFGKPDFALALHVTNDEPTGTVTYTVGPALASSTSVDVVIKGRGGHGASPQLTVDPIVLAALVVLDLQTIVSREIDPIQPSVVTVGSIQGGTKHNIIPDEVKLQLTLRAYRDDVAQGLLDGIRRRIKGLAEAHRAPAPTFAVIVSTPPTVNTPALVERVLPALRRELGEGNVKSVPPVMGAEDFGLFGRGNVPTFMFRLGSVRPDRLAAFKARGESSPSLHSSRYYPDPDETLRTGVRSLSAAVRELLPPAK